MISFNIRHNTLTFVLIPFKPIYEIPILSFSSALMWIISLYTLWNFVILSKKINKHQLFGNFYLRAFSISAPKFAVNFNSYLYFLANLFSLILYLNGVLFCNGKINNLMIGISNFIIFLNISKFLYNFAVTGATSESTALIFIDLSLTCCVKL